MDQEIINAIVQEVLKRIGIHSSKQIVSIIGAVPIDIERLYANNEILEKNQYKVRQAVSNDVLQRFKNKNQRIVDDFPEGLNIDVDEILNETDLIIIPELSINLISKIASGYYDDFVSKLLLLGLLHNKRVIASNRFINEVSFQENPILQKKLMENIHFAKQAGINFVRPDQIVTEALQLSEMVVKVNGFKNDQADGMIMEYTDRILDVKKLMLMNTKELICGDKTLITDMAKDYAREKGILIKRKAEDKRRDFK